jgi:hypothetical protein
MTAVEALMYGVVFAVDRQNRDPPRARGAGHEGAGHDQHLLVRKRDGLARIDGGQHRFQPRRT